MLTPVLTQNDADDGCACHGWATPTRPAPSTGAPRHCRRETERKLVNANFSFFQAGTGDEFLDELLSNDASLDDGTVPDIKVIDSSINMSGNEVFICVA